MNSSGLPTHSGKLTSPVSSKHEPSSQANMVADSTLGLLDSAAKSCRPDKESLEHITEEGKEPGHSALDP